MRMTKAGWGRIINMGSVFGEGTPMPGLSIYCGTKFAVRGLTLAWCRDLGPAGVTVNNIQPALTQKERCRPTGRHTRRWYDLVASADSAIPRTSPGGVPREPERKIYQR